MGTGAHVIVVGGRPGLAELAVRRIARLESLWSRFRPESDVSRLNARPGTRVAVAPETTELVARALDGWRITEGAFDPTLLGAVVRAGYDRTFAHIPRRALPGASHARQGAAGIEAGPGWVRLPAWCGFDPGGIGKGLAADMVVDELIDAGAAGACVNLGGDLRVAGEGPDGGPWTVGIEHPWSEAPVVTVGLAGGAVATSTTLRRRWRVGGEEHHHLIDPQTERPAGGEINLASVLAARAWTAEVLAKAVLLTGTWANLLPDGVEALAVDADGRIRSTSGLRGFLGGVEPPRALVGV
jgi:FAD:protein FMN transferase